MPARPDLDLIEGRASNLYLCIDENELTLIDAGMPGDEKRVLERIAQLGRHPGELTRILLTHADIDHAGGLAALQAATGATVFAGSATAAYLQQGSSPPHLPKLVQWFADAFIKYRPVPANCLQTVDEGEALSVWGGLQAIATPGHTPDHFSFYSAAKGILFAGDAINTRGGRLQPSPPRITADQEAATRSACHLLELAPALFACGHGPPFQDFAAEDVYAFFNQLRGNL